MTETSVLTGLARIAPKLKGPIQLAGFVAVVAALVMSRTVTPEQVVSQLAAAGAGVAMILFGLLLGQIKSLPENQRGIAVIVIFVFFLLFLLVFLYLILTHPRPVPAPEPTPTPTATPTPTPFPQVSCKQTGWGSSSGGPIPGCGCGTATVNLDSTGLTQHAGQEVVLNWEANSLCRGQGSKDDQNTIDWGDGTSVKFVHGEVCQTHVYDRAGNYTAKLVASVVCYDTGAPCENRCVAKGELPVTILR